MKDLFCLVNSFISRAKTGDRSSNEDQSILAVPFEASEDVRILPGASRKNNPVLISLEPFLQLLPDLSGVNLETQKVLHSCLYSAGVSAALSLHQYLYDPQKNGTLGNAFFSNIDRGSDEWKEILDQLGKYIDYDESAKAFRKLSQKLSNSDLEQILRSEGGGQSLMKMISNEVAAAALAAFASATYRRPPTKHVESIMAPAQEAGAASTEDDNCTENFPHLIRDSSVIPPTTVVPSRNVVEAAAEVESASKRKFNFSTAQSCVTSNDNSNPSSIAAFASDGTEESEENEECECDVDECEYIEDEDCLFRYVCSAGYEDLAKMLVELRNSTEFSQQSESTPLMEACCGGHSDVVRILIEAGANVNAVSSTQNTALIYACGAGHFECVKELLKSRKCDLSIRNENGHCALMEAASIGNVKILRELVEYGATPVSVIDNLDFKESALTLAAYKGHVEAVEFLISVMPDNVDREEEFHTALMEASMDGHVHVTKALLNAGAPVNLPSDSFESPLTLAACGGHTELVGVLIDFGADLEESNDEGYTPLMEASREGHRDVVELLLDRGANVNAKIEEGMETPLTLAASGGFLNVVELLVARGGDVTIGSPLYEATQEGHADVAYFIVQQLRQTGTHMEILKDLNSCLLCAAEINNVTICNMLLENNAQIETLSQEGKTSLMEASRQGNLLVVELLIHKGANVNTLSPGEDWTALSLAASHGHADIVRYLLEHGADPHQPLKDSTTCLLEATKNGQTNCVEVLLDYSVSMCPLQCGRGVLYDLSSSKTLKSHQNHKSCSHSKTISNIPKAIRSKSKNFTQKDLIESTSDNKKSSKVLSSSSFKSNNLGLITNNKTEKIYTDKDYANAFSTLLQQQEQLIQQHSSTNHSKNFLTNKASQTNNGSQNASSVLSSVGACSLNGSNDFQSSSNASQLFRALAAAAASSSSYNGPDDWLFAQFIQRSLITTKKRETMSEEELRSFAEMIQHQFRTIFPTGQVDAAALVSSANSNQQQQITSDIGSSTSEGGNSRKSSISHGKSEKFDGLLNDVSEENNYNSVHFSCCHHTPNKITIAKKVGAKNQIEKSMPNCANTQLRQKFQKDFSFDNVVNSDLTIVDINKKLQEYSDEFLSQLEFEDNLANYDVSNNLDINVNNEVEKQVGIVSSRSSITCNHQPQHHFSHSHCQHSNVSCCNTTNCINNTLNNCCSVNSLNNNSKSYSFGNQKGASLKRLSPIRNSVTSTSSSSVSSSNTISSNNGLSDLQSDSSHDTALTLACVGGHTTLANLLIQRGADIEHRDKKGFTPLILAATGGHLEICKMLIEAGCQVDAQADRTKDTALSLACSGGRKEVVDYLLRNGANKEHRNISDYTPLSLAASGGYVDIIQLLLNNGAEINSRTGSKLGISPLMLSAMNGHEAATMLLLDSGSDINAQIETNRNTALTLACFQGRVEVVRILVQYGANVEHRAKTGLTPLMEAANGGYVDVGTILLESNADPNSSPVMTSRDTALTIAADKGHAAFVEMLIHAGAQINVRNKKGCSALWLACCSGHLETVRTLVKHNADTDAQDNRKVSSLMIAFRKGHVEIIEFLVLHVSQFPSDQECNRYISTLSDLDAISKCNNCLKFILQAKEKQAEEANKAAESLLELLAQEEALAESKKRSKQRQKEKKKAKRNAKKQLLSEDETFNEANCHGKKSEPEKNILDENQLSDESKDFLKTNENIVIESGSQNEDLRVPLLECVIEEPINSFLKNINFKTEIKSESLVNFISTVKPSSTLVHKTVRRQTRRGGRGTNGNNNLAENKLRLLNITSTYDVSSHYSKTHNVDESEWLRASKRRATTSKNIKPQIQHSISLNVKQNQSVKTQPIDIGLYIDEWVAEPSLSSKRKSHVMSVSSSAIARVIGRAGSNINAIREATNAHIEVEKMTTKREQATRMITIKGTADAIKNSIYMIEMLIKNQDTHISDILKQVMGNSTEELQSTQHNIEYNCFENTENISSGFLLSSSVNDNTNSIRKAESVSSPKLSSSTNVWQQRAAIRELQKSQLPASQKNEMFDRSAQSYNMLQERKAPGFERPNSYSNSQILQRLSPNNGNRVHSNHYLNDTAITSFSNLNFKNEVVSHSNTEENILRPLSDIWENSSVCDILSPPTSLNLTGLFGNGGVLDSTTALWLPNFDKSTNNENQSRLNQSSKGTNATSDWLSGIFPLSNNSIQSSNKLNSSDKQGSCEVNDKNWNLLDNWNSENLNSMSEFKWSALNLVENTDEKKSETFENCLNSDNKKIFCNTQYNDSVNLHYFANDFLQKETRLPPIIQQSSQQQFQQNLSVFNDLETIQQQKLNLNNCVDNSVGFTPNILSNLHQSVNFSFPSQQMMNAIHNGISGVSYTQQPQRGFQPSFIRENNQQSSQQSIFNNANNIQQSNFVHPPPGFVRQTSSSFYDQSMLNSSQVLSPIGSKMLSGTLTGNFGSNNLHGRIVGNHQTQQPMNFFSTNVPRQIQQQQQQIYKNNGMGNIKYDYATTNSNNQLDILSNQQQHYVVGDGLWSPPTSRTVIPTFGQSNHNSTSEQMPSKTWGNFEC